MVSGIDWSDVEAWAARSRNGEVCGILGCYETPEVRCDHCFNWYCRGHANVINLPGHQAKEPDREEFEYAGFKCLILRNLEIGHLNGYVGVTAGHVCYGREFEEMPYKDLYPIRVHGGVDFSDEGDGDFRPEGYWWLGFHCAHAWDLIPSILEQHEKRVIKFPIMPTATYKDFRYVKKQVESLADQVATLEFIDWEFTWVWPFLLPVKTARRLWRRHRNGSC